MDKKILEIYGDGGARGNPGPAASAFVVFEKGNKIHKKSRFLGKATNNEAEYHSIIMALEWVVANKINYRGKIIFRYDSELVVKQLSGKYKVRSENLYELYKRAINLVGKIKTAQVQFDSIPRSRNESADLLVNQELDKHLFGLTKAA